MLSSTAQLFLLYFVIPFLSHFFRINFIHSLRRESVSLNLIVPSLSVYFSKVSQAVSPRMASFHINLGKSQLLHAHRNNHNFSCKPILRVVLGKYWPQFFKLKLQNTLSKGKALYSFVVPGSRRCLLQCAHSYCRGLDR